MSTDSIYDEVLAPAETTPEPQAKAKRVGSPLDQLVTEFNGGDVIAEAITAVESKAQAATTAIQQELNAYKANQAVADIVETANVELAQYGVRMSKAEAMDLHKRAVAGEFDNELDFGGIKAGVVLGSLSTTEDLARALAKIAKHTKQVGAEPTLEYGGTVSASSASNVASASGQPRNRSMQDTREAARTAFRERLAATPKEQARNIGLEIFREIMTAGR